MVDTVEALRLAQTFDEPADGQAMKSIELIVMLLERSPAPFSRDQLTPGHITCSGLVLAPDGERLLLVHHRRLDQWLAPGGHVESVDGHLADVARREVIEETGAALEPEAVLAGADVHGIPARGHEPYHLHHDLLFRFRATDELLRVSEESHAVIWCASADFDRYRVPANIVRAYRRAVR
jgi:8-oxo-dGTP pyrophosphatase MutT (NUDIX family)